MERGIAPHTARASPTEVPHAASHSPSARAARTPVAWRVTNRLLTREIADCAFRFVGAERVGRGLLDRLSGCGIPRSEGAAVVARVRGWEHWPAAWEAYAAARLTEAAEAAEAESGGDTADTGVSRARRASQARERAALALFAACLLVPHDDEGRRRDLARRSAALYRSVAPLLDPPAALISVPYSDVALPGYLTLPAGSSAARPAPLVIFLNGGSSAKEELNGWRGPFLGRGFATLALDNPGTGEAQETTRFAPNQRDLWPALRESVAAQPALNGRVALVGVSLGAMLAVQLAAHAPVLAAVVAITPPFAPGEYLHRLSPLTRGEIAHRTGFPADCLPYLTAATGLAPFAPRLRVPTLVVGAGRDRIVPPGEAQRLYDALPSPRTLHWYPRASHCAFSHLPRMLADTARWLERTVPSTE